MSKKEKPLTLIRRDNGDWSLHPPSSGKAPTVTLASGPAQMFDGKWDRPNTNDYHVAKLMWVHHQAQQPKIKLDD